MSCMVVAIIPFFLCTDGAEARDWSWLTNQKLWYIDQQPLKSNSVHTGDSAAQHVKLFSQGELFIC